MSNIGTIDLLRIICGGSQRYYEWLKDHFKSFFDHRNLDWEWIRERIRA